MHLRKWSAGLSAVSLLLAMGCAHTVVVQIPPVVDAGKYAPIGIIQFSSDAGSDADLAALATQKFLQAVQEAQPGVPILELGPEKQVLADVKRKQLDFQTAKAIGEKYQLGALLVGNLQISPVKPNIKLSLNLSAVSAKAEVNAALNARLLTVANGATVWTASRSGTWTMAGARVGLNGGIGIGGLQMSDQESKYQDMVTELAYRVVRDFQPSYERRRVKD